MIGRWGSGGLALIACLLTACGAGGEDRPPDRPQPATARALPPAPGPLAPGTYTTTTFEPGFTFELDRGWQLLSPEEPGFLTLRRVDQPDVLIAFVRVVRVYDPVPALTGTRIPEDALLAPPEDLAAWLARHPRVKTTAPRTVRVAGVAATEVEGGVVRGYRSPYCDVPCVLTFAPRPDLPLASVTGVTARAISLHEKARGFIIGAFAATERFEAERPRLDRIVRSLRFTS